MSNFEEIDANIQDQHTKPIDSLFAQSVSNFTLSADATASGVTTLVYTFEATAGHGIIVGNEVLLLNVLAEHALQAKVLVVSTNTITLDRPIDHAFPAASTLGRVIITNMNVNGSVTPQIFTLRAGVIPIDVTRVIISMTDSTAMDDGTFGGLSALPKGLVFRIYNGFQKTIFNFKTNGEIAQYCYDVRYADKPPAGTGHGLTARISFGGQSKHGVVLRISTNDVIQWIVQDDLTGLDTLRIVAQGHETSGE